MSVLIVSMPNDPDSQVVKLSIEKLGMECDIFYGADFADNALWSYEPSTNSLKTSYRKKIEKFSLDKWKSIWMRRPCGLIPREKILDHRERAAAEAESGSLANSVLRLLEKDKFVANPLSSTRISQEKTFQFYQAKKIGLNLPDTIVSNSIEDVLQFHKKHNGKIVYKTLVPMTWKGADGVYQQVRTTLLEDPQLLSDCDLISSPGIYQKAIEKVSEIRVTILGHTVLALEKSFPERSADELSVDWRSMHAGAVYKKHNLPHFISKKCIELLKNLNLLMGCFDLMVDKNGEYYFLEVNPQGQFIWADQVCEELNHLEAIVEFLISRDPEFKYERKDRIVLSDLNDRDIFSKFTAKENFLHFGDVATYRYGQLTMPLVEATRLSEEEMANNIKNFNLHKKNGFFIKDLMSHG